ncbi:MAG: Uncharacterized protein G01um10143_738 [Parcubacteria group bacterium Gr01-1014_3]|nr:MAG: Uncharacterized protein G01um10143_738 [Parcubacteria group bacterium Gr01-1014_3]
MKTNHYFIILLSILFLGLGGYYLVHFGYYPVAFVNAKMILARSMNNDFVAAYQYYGNILGAQGTDVKSEGFKRELHRQLLNRAIDNILINGGLKTIVGNDLAQLVENKLSAPNLQSPELAESVESLYGVSLSEFRKMVLVPQAEREVLEGRLTLQKKELAVWLTDARALARVMILLPSLSWNGKEVVVNSEY